MPHRGEPSDRAARDRLVRRTRLAARMLALGATGAAAGLSAVAAHAFKGHDGRIRAKAAPAAGRHAGARVRVPRPQYVPSIAGAAEPLQPPPSPPTTSPPELSAAQAAAQPEQTPPLQTSGGS
jgi:hypothetical protein